MPPDASPASKVAAADTTTANMSPSDVASAAEMPTPSAEVTASHVSAATAEMPAATTHVAPAATASSAVTVGRQNDLRRSIGCEGD
jgi:hypothetical protein